MVPKRYQCEDGYNLGQKVRNIRAGLIKLSQEATDQLNAIGFAWNVSRNGSQVFENGDYDESESDIQ